MTGIKSRVGLALAIIFARLVCPFAIVFGNVKWYARCVAKGIEIYGRLVGVRQLRFWKLVTMWVASMTLFNDGVSLTFNMSREKVDNATMNYWQAILYVAAQMLGYDASELIDKRAVQMTMYT